MIYGSKVQATATPDIQEDLDFYGHWLRELPVPVKLIELGVRDGDSTLFFLEGLQELQDGLFSYDINPDCWEKVLKRGAELGIKTTKWGFIQADSREAAKLWPDRSVDAVFIDTIHTYPETLQELEAWEPKTSYLLFGHDFGNQAVDQNGVRQSVMEFIDRHRNRVSRFEIAYTPLQSFAIWLKS